MTLNFINLQVHKYSVNLWGKPAYPYNLLSKYLHKTTNILLIL